MLWIHTVAATTLNSCCVSIDRFIAIRLPFRYQDSFRKRRCFAVIILVWFISLSLPFLMFSREGMGKKDLFVSIAFTICLVPLLVVCFCYILIFKLARKQFRRILLAKNIPDSGENVRVRVRQNFKAIKTLGFVLSACIITWMPSVVLQLVNFYYMQEKCRIRKIKRSTHWFTTSEIATFAEPFAAPSISCPVFTNKMHHTLEHDQNETGWIEKLELVAT